MDNRLNILSWLMLMVMLSMMALQPLVTADDTEERVVIATEPSFFALPTVMAMALGRMDARHETPED